MGTLLLFVLQLPLDILQTTVLSNLPSPLRYVVLAITATLTLALSTYALAPPTTLKACDRMGSAAHEKLSQLEGDGHGIEGEPSTDRETLPERAGNLKQDIEDIRKRLSKLDGTKERIEQVVWSRIRGHVARTILSLPYLCTTLRLLYQYFSLSQDIEVLARRHSQRSAQDTPRPEPQSATTAIAINSEEHEMHSLDGV